VCSSFVCLWALERKRFFSEWYNFVIDQKLPQLDENIYQEKVVVKQSYKELLLNIQNVSNSQTMVFLNEVDSMFLWVEKVVNVPCKKKKWSSITISYQKSFVYLSQNCFVMDIFVRMSTADARVLALKKNQRVDVVVPYKNIVLQDVMVLVDDKFVLELVVASDVAKELDIVTNDWCQCDIMCV